MKDQEIRLLFAAAAFSGYIARHADKNVHGVPRELKVLIKACLEWGDLFLNELIEERKIEDGEIREHMDLNHD